MAEQLSGEKCLAWAARDTSGVLSPYSFNQRAVGSDDVSLKITHYGGEHDRGNIVGLNQHDGEPIDPSLDGIFDNYSMKIQITNSGPGIASQLLLVDEVI